MKNRLQRFLSGILALTLALGILPTSPASAETMTREELNNHKIVKDHIPVVVSLGDSFSSGEGNDAYYGMNKPVNQKILDEDWLSHRSTNAWPGQLQFFDENGVKQPLSAHRYDLFNNGGVTGSEPKWYFGAISGAETYHLFNTFEKAYHLHNDNAASRSEREVTGVLNVRAEQNFIDMAGRDNVEYVTVTLGGNDVKFSDVIDMAARQSQGKKQSYPLREIDTESAEFEDVARSIASSDSTLDYGKLGGFLQQLWNNMFDGLDYCNRISTAYSNICNAAPNAAVIIAGYPRLVSPNGGTVKFWYEITPVEASAINKSVHGFNVVLKRIVDDLHAQGQSIYFVDVEDIFGDNGAFATNAYINKVLFGTQTGDLDEYISSFDGVSPASFHPNATGHQAYARAVQNFIDNGPILISKCNGKVRIVDQNGNVTPADENYKLELTSAGKAPVTITLSSDGSFTCDNRLLTGTYSIRVTDAENNECSIVSRNTDSSVRLQHHNATELDILVSGASRKCSGTIVFHNELGEALEMDLSNDPLILTFTDSRNQITIWPANTNGSPYTNVYMPSANGVTDISQTGIQYSVKLDPGEYTLAAKGKVSGAAFTIVDGETSKTSVPLIVPADEDVELNLTLLSSSGYVGTWVDSVNFSSFLGYSGGTTMTLNLKDTMQAEWIMEASTDLSGLASWGVGTLPEQSNESQSFTGTWAECDTGIVFYAGNDTSVPIYFNLIGPDKLELDLTRFEMMAATSSAEGLATVALLETIMYLAQEDLGGLLFDFDIGISTTDLLGIDSLEDYLVFEKLR